MIELFGVYKFAFLLSPFVAGILSVLGAHLVSRGQGLQLMALAQVALVGNIFGHLVGHDKEVFCLLFSLLLFALVKFIFTLFKSIREQTYIVVYLSFIALSYFMVTLFPDLDSHFAVGFFGDIVSISNHKSFSIFLLFLVIIILYFFLHKRLVKSTIDKSILNIQKIDFLEEIYFTLGVLLSLYGLGFLFTLSFLIFPVLILGRGFKNLRQSLIVMAIVSGFSSMFGLALSIVNSKVATVPAQVLSLVIFMLICRFIFNKFRRVS